MSASSLLKEAAEDWVEESFAQLRRRLNVLRVGGPDVSDEISRAEVRVLNSVRESFEGQIVRVKFLTGLTSFTQSYCYRDPSNTLVPGDKVVVPVGDQMIEKVAVVTDLGRGTWDRTVTKNVISRLIEERVS